MHPCGVVARAVAVDGVSGHRRPEMRHDAGHLEVSGGPDARGVAPGEIIVMRRLGTAGPGHGIGPRQRGSGGATLLQW